MYRKPTQTDAIIVYDFNYPYSQQIFCYISKFYIQQNKNNRQHY